MTKKKKYVSEAFVQIFALCSFAQQIEKNWIGLF